MSKISKLAVNSEGFIFDPTSGEMFTVNSTGLSILQGLQEKKSLESIAGDISKTFRVALEQVEKDIFDFKCQLRAFQLT